MTTRPWPPRQWPRLPPPCPPPPCHPLPRPPPPRLQASLGAGITRRSAIARRDNGITLRMLLLYQGAESGCRHPSSCQGPRIVRGFPVAPGGREAVATGSPSSARRPGRTPEDPRLPQATVTALEGAAQAAAAGFVTERSRQLDTGRPRRESSTCPRFRTRAPPHSRLLSRSFAADP